MTKTNESLYLNFFLYNLDLLGYNNNVTVQLIELETSIRKRLKDELLLFLSLRDISVTSDDQKAFINKSLAILSDYKEKSYNLFSFSLHAILHLNKMTLRTFFDFDRKKVNQLKKGSFPYFKLEGLELGKLYDKLFNNLFNKYKSRINYASNVGLIDSEFLTFLIGKEYKTKKKIKFVSGVLNRPFSQVRTLVRTAMHHGIQESIFSYFKSNENFFKGYVLVAVLDKRTSVFCKLRHGKKWGVDKKPINHNYSFPSSAPYHFNCRSFLFPFSNSLDINFSSYEDWFASRDTDTQKSILGKTRHSLYKKNLLKIGDFFVNDYTISLKELKKKYGTGKSS